MKIKGLSNKRGWYYWQAPQKDGKRPKRQSLGTKDINEAVLKIEELKQQAQLNHSISVGSMKEAIDAYIADRKNGTHSARTSLRASIVLPNINSEMGSPTLKAISYDTIQKWRKWKVNQDGYGGNKIADSTINTYLRILKAFLTWCVEHKLLAKNPAKRIKLAKVKKSKQIKFCTVEQRDRLLENPPSEEISFILHFGFYAGLRFGEMVAMESNWIHISSDRKSGVLSVQKTKHWDPKDRELRTIKLHPKLLAFIDSYGLRKPFMLAPLRSEWKDEPNYRYNPKKRLKTYVKSHGADSCTYHVLRHSFATHLAQKGVTMKNIADLLGDDIATTERHYIAFSTVSDDVINQL